MTRTNSPLLDRDDASPAPFPLLPSNASDSRRWRFRRNIVIYLASRQGFSRRVLADVFDLTRSMISRVVRDFSAYDPAPDAKPGPSPPLQLTAVELRPGRSRRDAVLCAAYRQGISQRALADVFDVPKTTVGRIVKDFSGYDPSPRAARTTRRRRPERPAAAEGAPATSGRETAGAVRDFAI